MCFANSIMLSIEGISILCSPVDPATAKTCNLLLTEFDSLYARGGFCGAQCIDLLTTVTHTHCIVLSSASILEKAPYVDSILRRVFEKYAQAALSPKSLTDRMLPRFGFVVDTSRTPEFGVDSSLQRDVASTLQQWVRLAAKDYDLPVRGHFFIVPSCESY
jgi:hypothetical protein